MKISIETRYARALGLFLYFFLAFVLYFAGLSVTTENVSGANISNQSVLAKVNVSNQFPDLYRVFFSSPLDALGQIDISAGSNTTVVCNGSFSDPSGFDDVTFVNATMYYAPTDEFDSPDNNLTHYTNSSCGTCAVVSGTGNVNGTCSCQFSVQYFANFGNWICNMTLVDAGTLTTFNTSSQTYLNEVLGIALNNLTLDYGSLSVTQTTGTSIEKNITNTGNIPMNLSLRGYGGVDEPEGINYTMLCASGANITFGNQRYSLYSSTAFDTMVNLTNQSRQVMNLTIPKRGLTTNQLGNSTNVTYWRLRIPLGPAGVCNGTVIFKAVDGR